MTDRVYWTSVELRRLESVFKTLRPFINARVLDVGCGMGDFILELVRKAGLQEVYGLDASESAIQNARRLGLRGEVLDLNRETFPFPSRFFDIETAIEVLEHLEDVEHCLSEINRTLKDGGTLIVTTPNLASWHGRVSLLLGYQPFSLDVGFKRHYGSFHNFSGKSAGHIRGFSPPALKDILEYHGFHLDRVLGEPAVVTGESRAIRALRHMDRVLTNFPSIASGLVVSATKVRDPSS